MSYDLSVIIAARNEEFLPNTINDVLLNRRGKTCVIVICDGGWPVTPLPDHPDVTLVHVPESIGQRAAVNLGARLAKSPWIMKSDAHVSFAPGFDITLMRDSKPDWIVVPRLWNLHAFDWACKGCNNRTYQGPIPDKCGACGAVEFEKALVWLPRDGQHWSCATCKQYFHSVEKPTVCLKCNASEEFANIGHKMTDSMRFDSELHFNYFRDFHFWEGIAAFVNAKGRGWIDRLLLADIELPSDRLIERAREYVARYESLPLPQRQELRTRAALILDGARTSAGKTRKAKIDQLFTLIRTAQGDIVDTMSLLGACWFVRKDFYFDVLGGLDEATGSWGQMGTELAAKAVTSGHRLVCHRGTFYSHLFRTQHGFSFPYGMAPGAQEAAKQYSRNLWRNNAWPGQKYPLSWLLRRFAPIPGWTEADIREQEAREVGWKPKI